jgi:hypothetical protein
VESAVINPIIFAAYLIVAGVGSVFAVSQIIRIARKGGPHGTRSRAAAERLDLFPPDVELGAVQRTDAQSYTESEPITVAYPDGHRADLNAISSAVSVPVIGSDGNPVTYGNAEPDALANLRAVASAHPHADRRAVIDAYHCGYRNGIAAAEAEFQRVIVSSGERRSAVLRNGVDDL